MLVIAVAVVVMMMRATAANRGPDGPGGGGTRRPPRQPRPQGPARGLGPDDDPEFLRELDRRTRRDDGSPA